MRKIGIMGGTFDPIHVGHLMLAECAREELMLDEIWFMPTGHSYMKHNEDEPGAPTPQDRFAMTCLACEDNAFFRCLDMEVQRPGNTYTYQTIEELKHHFPEDSFYFIFGADCLETFTQWKEYERIIRSCTLVAAVRGDSSLEKMQNDIVLLEQIGAHVELLRFRAVEISSTEIRNRIREKKSVRYLVPKPVMRYIEEKGLYQA